MRLHQAAEAGLVRRHHDVNRYLRKNRHRLPVHTAASRHLKRNVAGKFRITVNSLSDGTNAQGTYPPSPDTLEHVVPGRLSGPLSDKGMSAVQFQWQLGLTRYETAFGILLSSTLVWCGPAAGRGRIVPGDGEYAEVDESYVGGRTRGEGRGVHHKMPVAADVEARYRNPDTARDRRTGGRYAERVRLAVELTVVPRSERQERHQVHVPRAPQPNSSALFRARGQMGTSAARSFPLAAARGGAKCDHGCGGSAWARASAAQPGTIPAIHQAPSFRIATSRCGRSGSVLS